MRRLSFAFVFIFALTGAAFAQGGMGPGPGTVHSTGGAAYVGPGDVFSTSAIGFYSCAQAYTAAYATALGNACDLVDSAAPTTVICTLKFLATGKVDLATASCTGSVAPAAKCAAATGGVCNINKVYNQVNPGTNDLTQATAANQPTITFSSTPTGTLPAINCGTTGSNLSINTSGSVVQNQPFSMFSVVQRISSSTAGFAVGGAAASGVPGLGSGAATNTLEVNAGLSLSDNTHSADGTWHTLSGLFNGASGAINVDGNDATGNIGTNNLNAVFRLCRGNGSQWGGLISEGFFAGATTNSTDRNGYSTNAHSSGRYNF